MQIIPALLETDVEVLAEKLERLHASGAKGIASVQIDVMDGNLVPDLTVTPNDLTELDFHQLRLDFHLMTEDPLDYVWELAAQQPQLPVRAVFGQVERMSEQEAFLQAVGEQKWEAGLALDLETPLDSLDDHVWSKLESVLLMAVPMGSQGRTFDPRVLTKITRLREQADSRQPNLKIYLDGGIKDQEFAQLQALNVSGAVIGSFLWQGDLATQLAKLA
jgi:ribulose-phosphate 3-epimerase